MRQSAAVLLAMSMLAVQPLQAEVPVYHDGTLLIDEVAAVDGEELRYYRDVQLVAQVNGMLELGSASPRPLARVDEAEVLLLQGDTLQASVHAAGLLSIPCVALEAPGVTREGNEFTVVLAETVMEPGRVCMSLVAVTPFDISVPLDLHGLAAGSYRVHVNDLALDFVLQQDQP